MNNTFPRGIELVTGCVIRNKKGEILLTKSPKWSNNWVIPGGHVEPGETIAQGAKREGEEETGLILSEGMFFYWGEIINPTAFHRNAHFVFFDYVFDITNQEVNLDNQELTEYIWVSSEKIFDFVIAAPTDITMRKYLEFIKK